MRALAPAAGQTLAAYPDNATARALLANPRPARRALANPGQHKHSHALSSVDGAQPAGTYRLSTDEEQISGLSFVAFARMTTLLYLPADARGAWRQVVNVDPAELAAALEADVQD